MQHTRRTVQTADSNGHPGFHAYAAKPKKPVRGVYPAERDAVVKIFRIPPIAIFCSI